MSDTTEEFPTSLWILAEDSRFGDLLDHNHMFQLVGRCVDSKDQRDILGTPDLTRAHVIAVMKATETTKRRKAQVFMPTQMESTTSTPMEELYSFSWARLENTKEGQRQADHAVICAAMGQTTAGGGGGEEFWGPENWVPEN
ncbi:MAG: hypothetical protein GY696_25525 [Gammaproteobacteria bacterium]|nr:hypothetical protein [Gammaproteobacteria bacterium]